jgi:hypothetical protein
MISGCRLPHAAAVRRLCEARFATVPETMRAAVIHETGPADVMTIEGAWPTPTLGAGQVQLSHCPVWC